MKHQIPLMLAHGGGAIVNTSSGAGVKGFARQAAYTAAKHGVIGLTKSAALDYAHANVRINAVCPGIVDTEMMARFSGDTNEGREAVIAQEPIGRMGRPDEGCQGQPKRAPLSAVEKVHHLAAGRQSGEDLGGR
jgi:NAD(P)-dependent dehydrogenase (short-subunit alcohol dehydrogenase family)